MTLLTSVQQHSIKVAAQRHLKKFIITALTPIIILSDSYSPSLLCDGCGWLAEWTR